MIVCLLGLKKSILPILHKNFLAPLLVVTLISKRLRLCEDSSWLWAFIVPSIFWIDDILELDQLTIVKGLYLHTIRQKSAKGVWYSMRNQAGYSVCHFHKSFGQAAPQLSWGYQLFFFFIISSRKSSNDLVDISTSIGL